MYSHPRLFGGQKFINSKYQVDFPVKLGILYDVSTRYIDLCIPTSDNIINLGK